MLRLHFCQNRMSTRTVNLALKNHVQHIEHQWLCKPILQCQVYQPCQVVNPQTSHPDCHKSSCHTFNRYVLPGCALHHYTLTQWQRQLTTHHSCENVTWCTCKQNGVGAFSSHNGCVVSSCYKCQVCLIFTSVVNPYNYLAPRVSHIIK